MQRDEETFECPVLSKQIQTDIKWHVSVGVTACVLSVSSTLVWGACLILYIIKKFIYPFHYSSRTQSHLTFKYQFICSQDSADGKKKKEVNSKKKKKFMNLNQMFVTLQYQNWKWWCCCVSLKHSWSERWVTWWPSDWTEKAINICDFVKIKTHGAFIFKGGGGCYIHTVSSSGNDIQQTVIASIWSDNSQY